MAEHKSLADRFIEVMAMINGIDPEIENPARHMMRANKRIAEQIIDNALRQAWEIAYHGQDFSAEVGKIIKDDRASMAATKPSKEET